MDWQPIKEKEPPLKQNVLVRQYIDPYDPTQGTRFLTYLGKSDCGKYFHWKEANFGIYTYWPPSFATEVNSDDDGSKRHEYLIPVALPITDWFEPPQS